MHHLESCGRHDVTCSGSTTLCYGVEGKGDSAVRRSAFVAYGPLHEDTQSGERLGDASVDKK